MSNTLDVPSLLNNNSIAIDEIVAKIRRRTVHTHEINKDRLFSGEYHHLFPVLKKYPDKFKQYTRMNIDTFNYILSKTEESLKKDWCNLHSRPIYPEERLVLTLRFLATGITYRQLEFSFRMGLGTVGTIIKETMDVIWDILYPIHMTVPTVDDFLHIAEQFEDKWGMPHVLSAIDGRHIRIRKPDNSGSAYYNYKGFHSIVLQAVVDANYKFIFVDVGGCGGNSDGGTFRDSNLYANLVQGRLSIPEDDAFRKSPTIVPYCFIGDGAYPLMEHLLKPFPGKKLYDVQKQFNRRLSRARVVVENAFGHVCQKWRIFYTTIQQSPNVVDSIVKCTCLLHNIIIDLEHTNVINTLNHRPPTSATNQALVLENPNANAGNFVVGYGEEVRHEFMRYFAHNPI